MTVKQFYRLITSGVLIGGIYILVLLFIYKPTKTLCLFKTITTIPCPSCGSTRAIMEIIHGNIYNAFYWNPLGIITFSLMLIIIPWVLYDKISNKESLYSYYKKVEQKINSLFIAIPLIILVVAIWIWNIYKGI